MRWRTAQGRGVSGHGDALGDRTRLGARPHDGRCADHTSPGARHKRINRSNGDAGDRSGTGSASTQSG